MPVFTVHAPLAPDNESRNAADRFVFIRDGFYVWAFLAGLFWLVYHRLWLALIGYIAVNGAIVAVLSALHVGGDIRLGVMLLIELLMGLEAATLWRWTLSRRHWRQLDVIVADDREQAERRFFDRWAGSRQAVGGYQPPVDRGEPPPVRRMPLPASSLYPDVVGSFPRPGSGR